MRPTVAQWKKWAEVRGLVDAKPTELLRLSLLVDTYGRQNEKYCNGDYHYKNPDRTDKNKNSELWERETDRTGSQIMELAKIIGFDSVDFGVDLYPVFAKGTDTCIHLPE